VPRTRLELAQPYGHWSLKPARLPISPSGLDVLLFVNIVIIRIHNCITNQSSGSINYEIELT
jgi:hypothetical protein